MKGLEQLSDAEQTVIQYLRSTQAIRDRCGTLFDLASQDQLDHFRCDLTQLDFAADYVIRVIQSDYPDLKIPFHSRWRHFEAGGVARSAMLDQLLANQSPLERARAKFDLAITSVLLDAGAGADWHYREAETGKIFQRSEGLAVASFHLFKDGGFSSDPAHPFQADAIGLQNLSESKFTEGFQVNKDNPLVGVEGRLTLMHQLGKVLHTAPELFGAETPRPGNLVDYLTQESQQQTSAHTVFEAVLAGFSEIWSGRQTIAGVNLGDVWVHSALPNQGLGFQLVPFHKLSQWLTYSLLEPLQELGITITDLDRLTGLPEYRNGGLCFDSGLLQPKHNDILTTTYSPDSEVIVEWRALTVILLDRIADCIRKKLNLDQQTLPLAKVLEGGTWAAGRQIAKEKRSGGVPPIQIISDGTVF